MPMVFREILQQGAKMEKDSSIATELNNKANMTPHGEDTVSELPVELVAKRRPGDLTPWSEPEVSNE